MGVCGDHTGRHRDYVGNRACGDCGVKVRYVYPILVSGLGWLGNEH